MWICQNTGKGKEVLKFLCITELTKSGIPRTIDKMELRGYAINMNRIEGTDCHEEGSFLFSRIELKIVFM